MIVVAAFQDGVENGLLLFLFFLSFFLHIFFFGLRMSFLPWYLCCQIVLISGCFLVFNNFNPFIFQWSCSLLFSLSFIFLPYFFLCLFLLNSNISLRRNIINHLKLNKCKTNWIYGVLFLWLLWGNQLIKPRDPKGLRDSTEGNPGKWFQAHENMSIQVVFMTKSGMQIPPVS